MKTLIFHGSLKNLVPDPIQVHARSVAEALSLLAGFSPFNKPGFSRPHVRVKGFDSRDSLYVETEETEIHIYPTHIGGGGGKPGVLQVALAAVIAVVNFFTFNNPHVYMFAASLAVGGLIQMLTPQPDLSGDSENQDKSRYLPSNKNTTKIGTPISLLFGRRRVYGHYLSFDVDAVDMKVAPKFNYCKPGNSSGDVAYCVIS